MKLKSTVLYWLAAASFAVGLEGTAQVGGAISDGQFITAMCLILAALLFMRLGFAAEGREKKDIPYGKITRDHARTEEPEYRQNRRGA